MKLARTAIYFVVALPSVWIAGTAAATTGAPALLMLSQVVLAAYGVPCAVGIAGSLHRQTTLLLLALASIVLLKFPDTAGITTPAMALTLGAGLGGLVRRMVQESQDPLEPPQEVPPTRPRPAIQEVPQRQPRAAIQEVPHERPRIAGQ